MQLSPLEKKFINRWQKGFPLVREPYKQIAVEMGISRQDVIGMIKSLKRRGVLSRVGAVVKPNTAGASTLAAMAVPPGQLEQAAAIVGSEAAVNHNYERENELNLWFVVTARNTAELEKTLQRIAQKTGHEVIRLPLEKAYHIDLGFGI